MKSEFTSLLDMAIARGGVHSELINEIHQAVLTQFRQRYPKQPPGVAAVVDETTGDVRIYSGEKNVTPDDFAHEAGSIARKVLIEKLESAPTRTVSGPTISIPVMSQDLVRRTSGAATVAANVLFWGYNLYFLLFILAVEANWIGRLFFGPVWENLKDIDVLQVVFGLVLLATPVTAMVMTIRRKLYNSAGKLGRVFFLFEIPVLAITALAAAIGGSATWFMQYVLVVLMTVPLIIYSLSMDSEVSLKARKILLFIQQQALVIVGYLVLLYTFVSPLIIGVYGKLLFEDMFVYSGFSDLVGYGSRYYQPNIIEMGLKFGFGLLVLVLVVMAVSIPYAVILLLARAWRKNYAALEKMMKGPELMKLQGVFLAVVFVIGIGTAIQLNNSKYLDMLGQIYESNDLATQEEMVKQLTPREEKLADEIKNFRNIRERYPLSKDDDTIADGYKYVFGVGSMFGEVLQGMFTDLAYPFVYQGEDTNAYQLEQQYQYVFGHSTYKTTSARPTSEMRNVKMTFRKYTVTTDSSGLAAKISIDEQYKNQSTTQQEIIYEFTLPDGSVVTELNLGPDLEFPGVIAPRGAAQRVYEAQIRQRRDPALLEQIGPSQYRLRVFPIPGQNDFTTLQGRMQRVQFAYVTPLTPSGFGLPEYQKASNMLSDGSTVFLLQKDDGTQQILDQDTKVIAGNLDVCATNPLKTTTLSGLGWKLTTNNGRGCGDTAKIAERLNGKNIALILDISTTNKGAKAVEEAKDLFEKSDFLTRNTVDLYKFNKISGGAVRLTPETYKKNLDVSYFGAQNWSTGLPKLSAKYDVVLIVTSKDTNLSAVTGLAMSPNARVYLVSDKVLTGISHQLTARLLQGGGGMKTGLTEALADATIRMESASAQSPDGAEVINKYVAMQLTTAGPALANPLTYVTETASGSANILPALANSVLFKMRLGNSMTEQTGDIKIMDEYGAFAKMAGMVTPFSSYVALVNELQRQQLEQFENSYNRYQEQSMTTANRGGAIMNPIPTPMMDSDMRFAPLQNSTGVIGGLFGVDMIGSNLSMMEGGGGDSFGGSIQMAPAMGKSMGSAPASILFGNSFMVLNVVVFGLGFAWYLVRMVRKSKVK